MEPVKTKTASLVAGSASGRGSWNQKPRDEPKERTAVTVPGTSVTCFPASGDIRVRPWMSWMRAVSADAEANADDGPTSSPAATAVTVTATAVRRARGDMMMASGAE